ncbi:AMP-binding protein, partial [Polynucleobacter yangtzensis]|uniref:AMP-binding protein n=1 Tax=Polynucleobacter yangtzensis TaxID=1743159 RepID=UPI000A61306A
ATIAFDAATFEIWGALLNGAKLALAPAGKLDLNAITSTLAQYQVNTLWLTAGLFAAAVEEKISLFANLKHILAGGDTLPLTSIQRLLSTYSSIDLINGYGPTETTTFALTQHLSVKHCEEKVVPIGYPLNGYTSYLLDSTLEPVPPGVVGELYIAGAGLARGYLG